MRTVVQAVSRTVGLLAARPVLCFVLIWVLAFTVRGALLASLFPDGTATGEAEQIAVSLATEGTFANPYAIPTGPTAHCPPLFPALVSLVYRAFGTGQAGDLALFLSLIAAFSTLYALLPMLAQQFGMPREAGVVAGVLAALLPARRSVEVFLGWDAPYTAVALAGLLLWSIRLWQRGARWPAWLALVYGAAWGAAAHLHSGLPPILACLLAAACVRRPRLRTILAAGLAGFGFVLALIPWTLRNQHTFGKLFYMRSNLGIELAVSNASDAAPDQEHNRQVRRRSHPLGSSAAAAELRRLGEIEYNRRELARAKAWVLENPSTFAKLTVERFFLFWLGSPAHPLEFAIIAITSLAGLWGIASMRRRLPTTAAVWLLAMASYSLLYYVVQFSNRYRAPIDWMLMLGCGLQIWLWLRGRQSRPVQPG
jgi:hypothetical protein